MFAYLFFSTIVAAAGVMLVAGAHRRWAWLVDPPTALWFCYSQSFLKAIGGTEFCRSATFAMGYLLFAAALFVVGVIVFVPLPAH
ncbi:hypothetical protein FHW12_004148 [Dokdonella fugitiva]|uniref:Uncharacterized protein n=1 Tax=Dokdonella fugitiva TaxID=328517 RepID=A0A839FCP9_9GAMM|nr:hypothetical protein [Dokdonella fugitiva]MBA8889901.1 hypothetical protein [Dokdonella fugitiva]